MAMESSSTGGVPLLESRHQNEPASIDPCSVYLGVCLTILSLIGSLYIVVLIVNPQAPKFEIQRVAVQYMIMTAVPNVPCSNIVSLNVSMSFYVTNPNKYDIKNDKSNFTVMYHDVPLGHVTIPAFDQPPLSAKRIETSVVVDGVSLMHGEAAYLLLDASLHDRVELRVVGDVGGTIRVEGYNSPVLEATVDCRIATSPRRKTLISKKCTDGFSK